MHHQAELILTLTGALSAALVCGYATHRLRLSPIVGYLLAGIAVGPFTPGFVAHQAIAEQLAEVGVILLMFGVGLQFHPGELLAVRSIALPGALLQVAIATALGTLVGVGAGWPLAGAIVFGLATSIASTVVLLRVLGDSGAIKSHAGQVAVGWLVVEDLFTVLVIIVLPSLARGGSSLRAIGLELGGALLKLAALLAFALFVGSKALPKLLEAMARTGSRELFTLAVLASALGVAVGSALVFGVSMALGAFIAGLIVGRSEFGSRAASEALPMRDAFAVLFFVSVGMLLDPARLLANARLTLMTLAIVLCGKPLAAFASVRLLGQPSRTALPIALSLAQIGEFSFILAALGRELAVLPEPASQALVAAAIVSITLNPLLFRLLGPAAAEAAPLDATLR